MTSNGSTGRERPISSIRAGAGTSTEAALALGRKLSEHLDGHDLLGRWMSYHLAELISAAEDGATIDQREHIIDTILRIWELRRCLPMPPLNEFTEVIAALERLGDNRPWIFSRLGFGTELPGTGAGSGLVSTATDLENLTRDTLLRLIWLAASRAGERNADWLALADSIAPTLETELSSRLRWLANAAEDAESDPDGERLDTATGSDDTPEHLMNETHAARLRAMAQRLSDLADGLERADEGTH